MAKFINRFFGRKTPKPETTRETELIIETATPERDPRDIEVFNLAYALRVFERFNSKKTEFLIEQLSQRKKTVFHLAPLLLHVEAVDLLDSPDACRMSPYGVFKYELTPETEKAFAEAFPGRRLPNFHPMSFHDVNMPIKSISLIGSLGSIAQNPKSDFDYWIGIDTEPIRQEAMLYFKEKLRSIEKWAYEYAGAEVHFFPLDLNRIRVEDFGAARGESSGSAQGKLLKEEYYRTMTLVAGQIPLWWIVPPGISDAEYTRLAILAETSSRIDENKLVDMGNVHNITMGEFYGAAIWQINKTMSSPFKSVLKMALLEEHLFDHGSKGLLCTEFKRRLFSQNEQDLHYLDPYILMVDRASAYLSEQDRLEDMDLLRRSLYIKAGAGLTLADHRKRDLPRKKQIMVKLVRDWKWNHSKIEHLNKYQTWSFKETQKFSHEINQFIVRTYKNVSNELNEQTQQVGLTISQRDLTVLGRKLFIFYSKRTNKVDSIRNVIEDPPALDGLTLQPHLNKDGKKIWAAYRALLSREAVIKGQGAKALLKIAPHLSEVLIWLVNNQLYDSRTTINLNTGPRELATHCTVPDLQLLLKAMKEFFPPQKQGYIDEEELLQKPRTARMFLIINLEESDWTNQIVDTGVCSRNNWGETFFIGYKNSQDGLGVARNFVRKRFSYDPMGALSHFRIFLPDREFKKAFGQRLDKYFGFKVVK